MHISKTLLCLVQFLLHQTLFHNNCKQTSVCTVNRIQDGKFAVKDLFQILKVTFSIINSKLKIDLQGFGC